MRSKISKIAKSLIEYSMFEIVLALTRYRTEVEGSFQELRDILRFIELRTDTRDGFAQVSECVNIKVFPS